MSDKHKASINLLKLHLLALKGHVEDIVTTKLEKKANEKSSWKRNIELIDLSERREDMEKQINRIEVSIEALRYDQEVRPHMH